MLEGSGAATVTRALWLTGDNLYFKAAGSQLRPGAWEGEGRCLPHEAMTRQTQARRGRLKVLFKKKKVRNKKDPVALTQREREKKKKGLQVSFATGSSKWCVCVWST